MLRWVKGIKGILFIDPAAFSDLKTNKIVTEHFTFELIFNDNDSMKIKTHFNYVKYSDSILYYSKKRGILEIRWHERGNERVLKKCGGNSLLSIEQLRKMGPVEPGTQELR